MNHLYITSTAARNMRSHSKQVPTETGGLLVGTLVQPAILAAGTPGPGAVKTFASFSSDMHHDRAFLNQTRQNLGQQVKYLGHWHKHPNRMTAPSGGDLSQAQDLLKTLANLGETQPTLLCVILQDVADEEEAIFPYVLESGSSGFRKLSWSQVADDSQEVKDALRQEPQGLSATDTSHPWSNPKFRFQDTPAGLARLEAEKKDIEDRGYIVTVRSRVSDRRLFFELHRGEEALACIFPPEFPLGAPRLLRMADGTEVSIPGRGMGWNSDMQVAELLSAIEASANERERAETAVQTSNAPENVQTTRPSTPSNDDAMAARAMPWETHPVLALAWIAAAVMLILELVSRLQRNRR